LSGPSLFTKNELLLTHEDTFYTVKPFSGRINQTPTKDFKTKDYNIVMGWFGFIKYYIYKIDPYTTLYYQLRMKRGPPHPNPLPQRGEGKK
jgi:hypothetical protein